MIDDPSSSTRERRAGPGADPVGRPPAGRRTLACPSRAAWPVRWRHRLAQLGAADARRPARTGRARRLLDLHLRQLAADAALRPRLGGEIRRRRADSRRRAHAGVRLRAQRRQRQRAVARHRVEYPVAIDNDYGVWRAFANHFWPAVYLADAEGRIRYHHFGEGEYAMTEMAIQQLLLGAGAQTSTRTWSMVEPARLEVAADWRTLRSPETYLGYGQASDFASGATWRGRRAAPIPAPAAAAQPWGLSGELDGRRATPPSRTSPAAGSPSIPGAGRQPRHGSAARDSSIRFRVRSTGGRRGRTARTSTPDGAGTLGEQRTYQLIRQTGRDRGAQLSRSSSSTQAPRPTASPSAELARGRAPRVGMAARPRDGRMHSGRSPRALAWRKSPRAETACVSGAERCGSGDEGDLGRGWATGNEAPRRRCPSGGAAPGPVLSERQWGTVREDYTEDGEARGTTSPTTRPARAPTAGARTASPASRDDQQRLCFALALWNGQRPDPQGAAVRPDQQRGQPRRGRQGVLLLPRLARRPTPT